MARYRFAAITALLATLGIGGAVNAQPPRPGGIGPPPAPGGPYYSRPPAFSPYLNLLRGGSSATLNYYGLVRPEMQFRSALQNLSGDVANNQQMLGTMNAQMMGLSATGHPTQFMNLGGYFMNSGGGMGASILGAGNPQLGAGSINLSGPTRQGGMGQTTGMPNTPQRR